MTADQQYLSLLWEVIRYGEHSTDRTGTGTLNRLGKTMRFDLSEKSPGVFQIPLLTTKRVSFKLILTELLWFISGDTKLKTLLLSNNHIWDEWPYKAYLKASGLPVPPTNSQSWKDGLARFIDLILKDDHFAEAYGDLGPIYGKQWRSWPSQKGGSIDQLSLAIDQIRNTPDSRRIIVSAWNPDQIAEMAVAGLPPCHCLFQFSVLSGKLHCQLYQRSCDIFLGVPFNIASYALLTIMVAQVCGLKPGEFIWTGHSVHLYDTHHDQAMEQLSREPRGNPMVAVNNSVTNLFDFTVTDFELVNYDPHPPIKAPIAV